MTAKPVIHSLTGLRGVAAMSIVLHHYSFWCAPFTTVNRPPWFDALFEIERFGMTCFFTLSGFVIAYNYLDCGWNRRPLATSLHFLYLRFSRLYPALLVFILMIVMMRWTSPVYANGFTTWTVLHLLSVQSWVPLKLNGEMPDANIFHVSWSISTEFMLYVSFAICMVIASFAGRFGQRAGTTAVIALVGLYLAVLGFVTEWPWIILESVAKWRPFLEPVTEANWRRWIFYISPYFRLFEFGLGVGAALVVMKGRAVLTAYRPAFRWLAAAGATCLFWLYIVLQLPSDYRPGELTYLLMPGVAFGAILVNCDDESWVNRVLSCSPLLLLGEISYSLYLFHPLSPRPGIWWPDRPFETSLLPTMVLNMAVTILCAIVFAYGMYRLVEMPSQKALRRLWSRTAAFFAQGHEVGGARKLQSARP
jgi:peptidoglycan/LPS O-acetylase OafA/YrhL